MGLIAVESGVANAFGGTILSLSTTPGRLRTLSAIPMTEGLRTNSVYIEIGLLSGGSGATNRAVILGAGYCGDPGGIGWDGEIPISEDDLIFANCFSFTTIRCRLMAKVTL